MSTKCPQVPGRGAPARRNIPTGNSEEGMKDRFPHREGNRSYTAETFVRAAERVCQLKPQEHHSCLNPERLAAALLCAAEKPDEPGNIELLDSLSLVVYVPVL